MACWEECIFLYCWMNYPVVLLSPFDLRYHLILKFLDFFGLHNLCIGDSRVLKSPTTIVLGSICALKSNSVCLMTLGTLTMDAYKLTIIISSQCIAPFINMK
jgi:hypothetical protein